MNRRSMLSSIRRGIDQRAASNAVAVDHSTVERMSIADLDRIGPRLVPPPVETAICIFCSESAASEAHFPYCSVLCALGAEKS